VTDILYRCGDPGVGQFTVDLTIAANRAIYIDDDGVTLADFFFVDDGLVNFEVDVYKMTARRLINCGGTTPVDEAIPPVISAGASGISIAHIFGETECRTPGDLVKIFSDGSADLMVNVTENLAFLDIEPSEFILTGGEGSFTPFFNCTNYVFGDNGGPVFITATDLLTGLVSNQLTLPTNVQVNQ
jgi:hypothetical protein